MAAKEKFHSLRADKCPRLPLGSQALRGARGRETEVGVHPSPLPFHSTSAWRPCVNPQSGPLLSSSDG